MAFNRASRAGQLRALSCISDPTYQGRVHAAIAAAALRASEGLTDESEVVAAMETASRAEVERLQGEHARFGEHLDESVLTTNLDGVARVTIRGLSGAQLADAEAAGRLAATKAKAKDSTPFLEAELLRAGLVSVDGFDEAPGVNGYPVEALSGPGGMAEWGVFRGEVAIRIRTWSTLGESALSSSVP